MAFPSSSQTSLGTAWAALQSAAGQVKNRCVQLSGASAIQRRELLDFQNLLADSLATLDTYSAAPGLLAYVRNELNNPTIDVVAEFNTMRTQIVAMQDWTVSNFIKDANGNLVVYAFNGTKRFADIALSAPQLSALKTQIGALSATIA